MDMAPIVWTSNSIGVGLLTSAKPKVDGGQDDKRVWELAFAVDLPDVERAEVDKLFHGVRGHFQGAAEQLTSSTLKVKPLKGQMIHLDLCVADDKGAEVVILKDLAAEVRFVQLKLNQQVKAQTARVNLRGVDVEASNAIVGLLEKRVRVKVTQDQGTMFAEAGKPDEPEIGDLVSGKSGDKTVTGLMVRKTGDKVVIDDFGVVYTLDSFAMSLTLESADDTDVVDHEERYKTEVEEAGGSPSWEHIAAAMANAWAAGEVAKPEGKTAYLNAGVIDAAIAATEHPSQRDGVPERPEGEGRTAGKKKTSGGRGK